MQKKESVKKEKTLSSKYIMKIIGECVEGLCKRQSEICMDNSYSSVGKQDGVAEMIKLLQLLEKYIALHEKITPEKQAKAVVIDYALLRNYLNKVCDDSF